MPRLFDRDSFSHSFARCLFAAIIAIQLIFPISPITRAADNFTSSGVGNPDLPASGNSSLGADGATGNEHSGSGNNVASSNSSERGNNMRQACLGTDILSDHGFTKSEMDRLEQENKLWYLDGDEYLDTDKDGLFDKEEIVLGTDPNKIDTDGDGFSDALELVFGFDPLNSSNARPFMDSFNDKNLWANQIIQMLRHALLKLYHLPPNWAK